MSSSRRVSFFGTAAVALALVSPQALARSSGPSVEDRELEAAMRASASATVLAASGAAFEARVFAAACSEQLKAGRPPVACFEAQERLAALGAPASGGKAKRLDSACATATAAMSSSDRVWLARTLKSRALSVRCRTSIELRLEEIDYALERKSPSSIELDAD